ncbi:MAG: PIN domain-containing protein [Spirochaetaceae bacterium]|nr:PIN domain-containing protein [Spirochaetaceae bacterium]
MNVYVESNFVLELALEQEQSASCEGILELCEKGQACLVVPAFCLAEPHGTLAHRRIRRREMKRPLDEELKQIARTATNTAQLSGFESITDLLISSAEQESRNLNKISSRLLSAAESIPLDASVLGNASGYQTAHGFSPQDSIVYASIISHLRGYHERKSYFISRDSDFEDQDVIDELGSYNCNLVPRFDQGRQFIIRDLRNTPARR